MIRSRHAVAVAALLAVAMPAAAADDAANFLVRLGRDTVSVEHDVRTPGRVEVDQVGRAPRVMRRHFVYEYAGGAITKMSFVATPPGAAQPTQTIDAKFDADSMHLAIQAGTGPLQNSALAVPKGSLVVASSSPWSGYEGVLRPFAKSHADSVRGTMYFIGAPTTDWYVLERLGRDSVIIRTGHQDVYHVRVDAEGRLLGVMPISGTQKFSVERIAKLDVDAMAASFAAEEKAGSGLGMLSPRDTVRVAGAGGAALWIDYGRPSKRGRAVFGGIVPWGEVWRTGANAATQFRTDKDLDFSGTVVPAGFYTLWTIPTPGGWKLVVNSETGQWGTEHKAAKDLFTIDMKLSDLPQEVERFVISVEPGASGGVIHLDWDRTRASAAFSVKP